LERARYKYMELTSEDPQAFGRQLTRALSELRAQGCEIVDVSMDLIPGENASGKGPEGMLRVAQILILEPAGGVKPVKPATILN
jgi:hypothetical protein